MGIADGRAGNVRGAPRRGATRVSGAVSWLRRLPLGPVLILTTFVAFALFAELIAPHDPLETNLSQRLLPPVFASGTSAHLLGTDQIGRDLLSRIIVGARLSLIVAAASILVGVTIGVTVGIVAGYSGGKVDALLMRIVDLAISYPVIILALLLAIVFGPSTLNVVLAISFTLWSRHARILRGETLSIRERGYIALAQVAGASPFRIARTHILPNIASTILVLASLQAGGVVLAEASLSFLGAGVPPPNPAWGSMVALGRDYVATAWWLPTMPGIAIALLVLALNMFGDWVRDELDPRLRNLH